MVAIVLLLRLIPSSSAQHLLTRIQARRELGLEPLDEITTAQLKAAYRKRSLETHPDKAGGSNEAFVRVSEAYQVLSASTDDEKDENTAGGTQFNRRSDANDDGMSDAERLRQAEDMFFDMFGDLFDKDTVGATIDDWFRNVKPTVWIRMLKFVLKVLVPKLASLLESDAATLHINGVTLTGKEFGEMREARRRRLQVQQRRRPKEDL